MQSHLRVQVSFVWLYINMVIWYCLFMRTTIDIPDSLYRRVKIKAFERGSSVKELMINGLMHELDGLERPPAPVTLAKEEKGVYAINDLGFVVLKPSPGKKRVTDALVNQLREKEGV